MLPSWRHCASNSRQTSKSVFGPEVAKNLSCPRIVVHAREPKARPPVPTSGYGRGACSLLPYHPQTVEPVATKRNVGAASTFWMPCHDVLFSDRFPV